MLGPRQIQPTDHLRIEGVEAMAWPKPLLLLLASVPQETHGLRLLRFLFKSLKLSYLISERQFRRMRRSKETHIGRFLIRLKASLIRSRSETEVWFVNVPQSKPGDVGMQTSSNGPQV
jgi:hypothetical protein